MEADRARLLKIARAIERRLLVRQAAEWDEAIQALTDDEREEIGGILEFWARLAEGKAERAAELAQALHAEVARLV